MKKSYNVNICGVSYCIDEDAMQLLEQCIENARNTAKRGEMAADTATTDFERRIGDALCARVGVGGVVTLDVIKEVLENVGMPLKSSDTADAHAYNQHAKCNRATGETDSSDVNGTQDERGKEEPWRVAMSLGNKLYRDPYDKLLGGVLSGIAHYTGVSCAALRLLTLIASFLLFWIVIIGYIIMWVVLPVPTDAISVTRMHRVKSSGGSIEEQWKANYERSVHEMRYGRCGGRGCSTAFKGLLFMLLAVVLFPFVVAAAVLVFLFFAVIAALLSVFGAGLFATSYIALLLLLPVFAFGHWILKKCDVCRPLGRGVKAVIIIGWLVLFAFAVVNIHERIEQRGGWEKVDNELFHDYERLHDRLMRRIDYLVSHSSKLTHYILWRADDRGLPFHVVFKRGINAGSKEFLFYNGNGDAGGEPIGRITLHSPDTQGIAIYCLWDSVANEMIVDGSDYIQYGYSGELLLESNGMSMYFADEYSAVHGDSVRPAAVPIALRCYGVGFWQLNLFGDKQDEGICIEPIVKHVGYMSVFDY